MKLLRPQGRIQVLTSPHLAYQGFHPLFLTIVLPLSQLEVRAAQ